LFIWKTWFIIDAKKLANSPRSLNSPDSGMSEKEKMIDRIRAVCVGRNIRMAFCAAETDPD